jgi:NADP-dependent 3-hydroxy acid dehydrogenase YdfG
MIAERFGRIDILVNNAGINIGGRHWKDAALDDWDRLIKININGVYYGVAAVLPIMRRQGDGLIINTASWAGKHNSYIAGVAYGASKHAVVAMNATINIEEGRNGIRACAISPAEVATPILDRRPVPVGPEERAKMLQPEDLAETVLYVARLPARACVNEILISPTHNRFNLRNPDIPPSEAPAGAAS